MEDNFDLIQLFKTIWAKRKRLCLWTGIGLAFGVIIAISMPNEYVCDVLIAPESKDQNSAKNSLGGLASMMGMGSLGGRGKGLNEMAYSQIVQSTPFLSQFDSIKVEYEGQKITLINYLNKETKVAWWSYVMAVPSMMFGSSNEKNLTIENKYLPSQDQRQFELQLALRILTVIDPKTDLITVTVKMQDPIIAAQVADSVVVKLNAFMIDYQTSKTRADLAVNETMMHDARDKYYIADEKYAQAVDRNRNLITKSRAIGIERLQNERNIALQVYQQLATQVELTRIKLQEDTPIATVINPPIAPASAASPKKKLITIVMGLLFAIGYCGVILFNELSGGTVDEKVK